MLLSLASHLAWTEAGIETVETSTEGIATVSADKTNSNQSSIESVERELDTLKVKLAILNENAQTASQELSDLRNNLGNSEMRLMLVTTIQTFLNPTRLLSPLLANMGYIFGAIALLYIVLTRSAVARKLLSVRYPFSIKTHHSDQNVQPLTTTARWVWAHILLLLLFLLAIPALAQESAEKPAELVSETQVSEETTTLKPAPDLDGEMHQAIEYIELSPLERAIFLMESTPEEESFNLVLEESVLNLIQDAAAQNRHLPLVKVPFPSKPLMLDLERGTPGYYVVLASLYEAANRSTACDTLVKGISPFTSDQDTLKSSMPFESLKAVLLWLAVCNDINLGKKLILAVAETAPDLQEVTRAVSIAEDLGLTKEMRSAIEINISQYTQIEEIEGLATLAKNKGFNDLAVQILEANYAGFDLEIQLRLIRRLHEMGDIAKIETMLEAASKRTNVDGLLLVTETAADLGLQDKAKETLSLAFQLASKESDADKILATAVKLSKPSLDLVKPLMLRLQEMLASKEYMLNWLVATRIPSELGAARLELEGTSLSCIVAAALLTPETQATLRPLFEGPVVRQLEAIIESLGANQEMRINDLYILARYYELEKDPALEVTRHMVALQESLRGLDRTAASEVDVQRLAMIMEMEQLRSQGTQLEKTLAETKAEISAVNKALSEVRARTAILLLENLAKGVLLLLGLWIALSCALAASRGAKNWVFSQFCWKFTETIGFEFCCTLVMLPVGIPITLFSQDRLKHLALVECSLVATECSEEKMSKSESLTNSITAGK